MVPKIEGVRLNSILDNDFYKFTMQNAVVKLFPNVRAKYHFINRGEHQFPDGFADALQDAVNAMATLKMTDEEKLYLRKNCPYISPAYIDFLQGYRYDPSEVKIIQDGADVEVYIEGNWYRTILWEVPIMSLICELFYKMTNQKRWSDEQVIENTLQKTQRLNELGVKFAEFGTRRRHSYAVHRLVMKTLTQYKGNSFTGTSNVHLAMLHNVKPIGTHAHEWFMFHAARYGFKMANRMSLDHWVDVYRGDLGVALSDTYTTNVFLRQFDTKFAKLFDGVRHDSGDPIEFTKKMVSHYSNLGINPQHKMIIFSDGLNTNKVEKISAFAEGKIGISFGIGTNLTNDVGLKPMNIVIKLTDVNFDDYWVPTIKISDERGKYTGDPEMISLAKDILRIDGQ